MPLNLFYLCLDRVEVACCSSTASGVEISMCVKKSSRFLPMIERCLFLVPFLQEQANDVVIDDTTFSDCVVMNSVIFNIVFVSVFLFFVSLRDPSFVHSLP